MEFKTRKIVMPNDLNAANTLFGGRMLEWIDEESAVFVSSLINSTSVVTAHMGEINFLSPAHQGDIVEIGVGIVKVGTTSVTVRCSVRHHFTKKEIVTVENIVFVHIVHGVPTPHVLHHVQQAKKGETGDA